jgi:hypothetical protein
MKKVLLWSLLLLSISASAQILEVDKSSKYEKVGEVKAGGSYLISSMQVKRDLSKDSTNSYIWIYNSLRYRTLDDIKSITFNATDKDFDLFYEMLKLQLTEPKGTEKEMILGKTSIKIKTLRGMGTSALEIFDLTGNGFFNLSLGQLNKLFGKK